MYDTIPNIQTHSRRITMKKTLLLSVVASTMIMAGGDIAPVEPIIVPVVESGWKFDGNMVAYYQTRDNTVANDPTLAGDLSLFGTDASANNFGIQLRAVNDDLFWGLGAGFEVTGMATSGLISDMPGGAIQTAGTYDHNIGGALTQAYLTYNIDMIDTGLKIGRQTLPKSLSPFAFSEQWTPVQNTFDAALVVNSSIPDTTLVYAFVDKANASNGNLDTFGKIAYGPAVATQTALDGVHMVTAQNKSIEGLTLTGSFYIAPKMVLTTDDLMVAWGDAKFNYDGYSVALQGGTIITGEPVAGIKNTIAYGAEIGAKYNLFDMNFDTSVAYSSVDNGTVGVFNAGGVKTPLYTQMILNQNKISLNSNTVVARIGVEVLGGHLGVAYDMSTVVDAVPTATVTTLGNQLTADYAELDVTYKTKITDNTELFAAYVMTDDKALTDTQNFVRVWARYNFK